MQVTRTPDESYTVSDLTAFELVALHGALWYGAAAYLAAVQLTTDEPTWLTAQAETMLALSDSLEDVARRASLRPSRRA
jgi:hypothetical protein